MFKLELWSDIRDVLDAAAYQDGLTSANILTTAVTTGHAYRISGRQTLDDGQEFTVHIDPNEASGTVHMAAPAILPDEAGDIDIYENAVPQTTVDDLTVHNMRYDEGAGQERPEATVVRVPDSDLDTTDADRTEQARVFPDQPYPTPGDAPARAIWRTIPPTDTVSIVITDTSGGNANVFSFAMTLYEGDTLPD